MSIYTIAIGLYYRKPSKHGLSHRALTFHQYPSTEIRSNLLIFSSDICRINECLPSRKAQRFMMCNTVSQRIDFIQFVENVRLVNMQLWGGTLLEWKCIKQTLVCQCVLHRRIHTAAMHM